MTFKFEPAKRESVSLLIGLAGASGSGKTYSAMQLATGLAGDAPFAVIDTEAGRAKHYADEFRFDHGDLRAPFTPAAYADAIAAADEAAYPVIVVDSFSHEHAGDGGLLDMHDAEFERMGAKDSAKMSAWIKPKGEHKRMVSRLLQVRAHLILCLRAEEKIEMVREGGKTVVRPKASLTGLDGWVPICEKNLPYELTVSFLLVADKPGVPRPIKLPDSLRPYVPLDQPLSVSVGSELGKWAAGSDSGDGATVGSHGANPGFDENAKLRDEVVALLEQAEQDTEQFLADYETGKGSPDKLKTWLERCKTAAQQKADAKTSPFKAPAGATG